MQSYSRRTLRARAQTTNNPSTVLHPEAQLALKTSLFVGTHGLAYAMSRSQCGQREAATNYAATVLSTEPRDRLNDQTFAGRSPNSAIANLRTASSWLILPGPL